MDTLVKYNRLRAALRRDTKRLEWLEAQIAALTNKIERQRAQLQDIEQPAGAAPDATPPATRDAFLDGIANR
jgi:hypothetical protein